MDRLKGLVLITGANQGIGFALATQLAQTGNYHVLLGARDPAKGNAAISKLQSEIGIGESNFTMVPIDVTSDESIANAVELVREKFGRLDILINNAGIAAGAPGLSLRENIHAIMDANVAGAAVAIDRFLPLIRASSYHDRRIINVTSGLGLIGRAKLQENPVNAKKFPVIEYRMSKSALNMLSVAHSVALADENIAVVVACPGFCRTNLTGGRGARDASDGAAVVFRAATQGDPKQVSGTHVTDADHEPSW
ncbi:short-chain dehydrogenase [Thozetella sp. PMI_491]|nr:short-chain dehydrogenase [Thozetella sp. PMI_491]